MIWVLRLLEAGLLGYGTWCLYMDIFAYVDKDKAKREVAFLDDLMRNNHTPIHETFDAQRWALYFDACRRANPKIATDVDCMRGWFANALMAGYDHRARHPPESRRASQHAQCAICQKDYGDHVALHQLCGGELVKL